MEVPQEQKDLNLLMQKIYAGGEGDDTMILEDLNEEKKTNNDDDARSISTAAESTTISNKKKEESSYDLYKSLENSVPQVVAANQTGSSEFHHSLANAGPRLVNQLEHSGDIGDLKAFWQGLNPAGKNNNERFICIAGTLLKYVEADANLKTLFESFTRRIKNADIIPYVQYLMSGTADPFPISKVENPAYQILHQDPVQRKKFMLCRFVKVKKDLVECLIATFDSLCFNRSILTGFEVCDPQPPGISDPFKNRWFNNYSFPKANETEEEQDKSFTKGAITSQGLQNLYDVTSLQLMKDEIDDAGTTIQFSSTAFHHNTMNEKFQLELQGNKQFLCRDTNCFPLFRMLLHTYGNANYPPLFESARAQSCRIMKASRNTLTGGEVKKIDQGPAQVGCSFTIPPNVAVFCTKVSVTVKYNKIDMPLHTLHLDNSLENFPLRQEVVYEILDRSGKQVKLLASEPPRECIRASFVPSIYEPSLDLGWLMQTNPKVGLSLIDDFFANDYYLNVDPSLVFHNLHLKDRYSVSLEWQGIEGKPVYVAAYLLTSYLKSSLQIGYNKEVSHLVSKAVNERDNNARYIINECFPDALKALKIADATANNAFIGI